MSGSRYLGDRTGRGVRVAVVDSGVHAAHPHVRGIEGGVAIRPDGTCDGDVVDWLGHGTAVTAAIREKAPDAAIVAVKVFWRTLATDVPSLIRGIDEACTLGSQVINLSLGTTNAVHRDALQDAVRRVQESGIALVAALEHEGVRWLPGSLDGVVPVVLDWTCERDAYRLVEIDGRISIAASGYPRDIPNVPRERNLSGISFAVANASGFVARAIETRPGAAVPEILSILESGVPAPATRTG